MATLDPDDPRPPYLQVAAALREDIAAGHIAPGGQAPSYAQIAEQYGVSPGTARSAFRVLRDEGLIVTRHGKGSFVRRGGDVPASPDAGDLDALRREVARLAERLDVVERRLAGSGS
jgi:DNA-binding GntR family transcriptional regulator